MTTVEQWRARLSPADAVADELRAYAVELVGSGGWGFDYADVAARLQHFAERLAAAPGPIAGPVSLPCNGTPVGPNPALCRSFHPHSPHTIELSVFRGPDGYPCPACRETLPCGAGIVEHVDQVHPVPAAWK